MGYYAEFHLTGDTDIKSYDDDVFYISDDLKLTKGMIYAKIYKNLRSIRSAISQKLKKMDDRLNIQVNIIEAGNTKTQEF